jgi:ABC-type transport system involved in cytochrome bd biosynthesis fused ATPase/permease subunit
VGIARALVRRASVLLLDEPTAGLDAAAEVEVMAAIRAEAYRGAAVLLVAHRPGAVAGADSVVEVRWAAAVPVGAAVTAVALPQATPATPGGPA